MKILIFLTFSLFNLSFFCQEINLETTFTQNGKLYENLGQYAQSYTDFRKGQKCIVLEYLGRNNYKVKFKKWTGYVNSEFLNVNAAMSQIEQAHEQNRISELDKLKKREAEQFRQAEENKLKRQRELDEENEQNYKERIQREKDYEKEKDSIANFEMRNICRYATNEIDEFEKIKRIKTERYNIGETLDVQIYRYGNKKYVFFYLYEDLGCASSYSNDRSYVKIKLENNDIVTFFHSWDVDCGDFSLKGNLTNSDIIRLSKSPIKTIRLQGTDYYSDVKEIEYKEFFIDKMKCVD